MSDGDYKYEYTGRDVLDFKPLIDFPLRSATR